MNRHPDVSNLLDRYALGEQVQQVEFLGAAGGFSGAEFWRVRAGSGCWCIRKWPRQHPPEDRLRLIHDVLQHAWQAGFTRLPLPLTDRHGATFVCIGGSFWEITPWLSGDVIDQLPDPAAKLCSAMETLAEFHQAVVSFPGCPGVVQPSPGLMDRHRLLQKMIDTGLDDISRHMFASRHRNVVERAETVLDFSRRQAPRLLEQLEKHVDIKLDWQPCIRDIHRQHVLFQGSDVSAIIDFGAMNYDTVATDVARLLGSLAQDDLQCREQGLSAYQARRPLDGREREMVDLFDQANMLLSPLNWLQWIIVEGRQFDDWSLVLRRLDELVVRLTRNCR